MTVAYAESSAVLRWLLRGTDGPAIAAALAGAGTVFTSALTLAEVARTLARLGATAALTPEAREEAAARFRDVSAHWQIHAISDAVLSRLGVAFPVEPVRTLDAIHLATAARLANDGFAPTVCSTDVRVRENARALGLAVVP